MADGLDLAKVHLKTIFAQVQTFLDMHQVVSAGPFLYTFVQEVGISALLILTHTHTHNHLTALCLGLAGWAGSRRNIHPPTPFLIIRHLYQLPSTIIDSILLCLDLFDY